MSHKIMLIEDDQMMISLLQTLLTMEGFQVITVADGLVEIMLQDILREQPQVLLLDVNLRHANGIDLLSAIRANPELNHVRVIMSSGINYRYECLNKGAQGFLMKPYMPDELIKLISPTIN